VTDQSVPLARDIERHCRSLWASRLSLLARPVVSADRAVRDRLRDDLLDLAVIGSALRVRLEADPQDVARAHREGLALLDQAEALSAPSHVRYLARRAHATALGLSAQAEAAARGAASVPPRTAWEYDAVGRVLLASGDLPRAEASFERAIELMPQD